MRVTLLAANWARAQDAVKELAAKVAGQAPEQFQFFAFMTSSHYASYERVALWCVLGVAFAGLGYALMLVGQVKNADTGTEKMQKVAAAVREGAKAYLRQQFSKIVILIGVLTVLLFLTRLAGETLAGHVSGRVRSRGRVPDGFAVQLLRRLRRHDVRDAR